MSDFFQNGTITTLPRLGDRPLAELEDELRAFAARRKVALILPALASEFDGSAMPRILRRLKQADYLSRVILSLDRATEERFQEVRRHMRSLPVPVQVIWNDGPRVRTLLEELDDVGFVTEPQGKGRGVWLAMGLALADRDVDVVALHDCDIVNYRREMVARLIYPLVHPDFGFSFAKGYYARATDRLYGRVTRLFFSPLVRALEQLAGPQDLLRFLGSFRYALAGEFALSTRLARRMRIAPTWGLEVTVLAEVLRNAGTDRVCQVELAERYEHKHQPLSRDDARAGLHRMAHEVAVGLLDKLEEDGVVLGAGALRALPQHYARWAQSALDQYESLAAINGLAYDRHREATAVETFTRALQAALAAFCEPSRPRVCLASWRRVPAALPGFAERLTRAVTADNPALEVVRIDEAAPSPAPAEVVASW